jgi:N-acyl amino acid synthase of PEP-CTERM/exosortase system
MFDNHFEVVLADTEWAKNIHYNLRYRVYCLERGYEDPQAYPDLRERDRYDDISTHFVIRSFESHEWLAALRLITVPFDSLPINRVSEIYNHQLPEFSKSEVAELSRLCAVTPKEKLTFGSASTTSWISMAFMRAARSYALEHNIRYFFVLIADSLARILNRAGIEFTPVGPISNYRGKRRPYIHDVQLGYRYMPVKTPEIHKMFCHAPAYRLASESYSPASKSNNRAAVRQRSYDNVLFSRSI